MARPRTIRGMMKRMDDPVLLALWALRATCQSSTDADSSSVLRQAIREHITSIRARRNPQPILKLVK
jgi:hypothetical protein